MQRWSFDFAEFQPRLDAAIAELFVRLHGPLSLTDEMARGFFLLNVQMSRNAWHTVAYLCANSRDKESDWMWDYVLMVPAINRTILDSLFNTVFVIEDLPNRLQWFHESGWREAVNELERAKRSYSGIPKWDDYLCGVERSVKLTAEKFRISPEKQRNAKKLIEYWPNPGKMASHPASPKTSSRTFLQFANDWFYRESSAHAHLSFHGMMRIAALALRRDYGQQMREQMEADWFPSFRAENVTRAVTFILALLSEVEAYLDLRMKDEIRGLWTKASEFVPDAEEIFGRRYKTLLA